jgi:GNAT superfamily N-acetyltransferase
MELAELLALYDQDQRVNIEYPGERREESEHVVRHISQNLSGRPNVYSFIVYSRLNADNADAVIEQEKVYIKGMGHNLEWKCYSHDTPLDLGERLIAAGFVPEEIEAIMAYDLDNPADKLKALQTPSIRRITDPEQVDGLLDVQRKVWGGDYTYLVADLSRDLRERPDQLSMYGAYVDDLLVSSAWVRFIPGSQFASLWGGSTLEEYRGQGHYTALMAVRAQEAAQRGVRFLTVDASPMSRPILEKQGFQVISWANDYNCVLQPEAESE